MLTYLLIDVVEADKFPAALRQFKDEANRRVFPVVWSPLKGAVDPTPAGGFFFRLGAFKTLCGIGLALKNLAITAQEILLVLYGFYQIGHRQWEFRHARYARLIASNDRRAEFFPECRKVALPKSLRQEGQN